MTKIHTVLGSSGDKCVAGGGEYRRGSHLSLHFEVFARLLYILQI